MSTQTKSALKIAVLAELERLVQRMTASAQATRSGAVDPENRGDGKYDTRSTEANYLADGQAKQAALLADGLAHISILDFRDFLPGDAIDLSALIQLQFAHDPLHPVWFLLVPAGGGTEIPWEGDVVTLLSPDSPLGQLLRGQGHGHTVASPAAKVLAIR